MTVKGSWFEAGCGQFRVPLMTRTGSCNPGVERALAALKIAEEFGDREGESVIILAAHPPPGTTPQPSNLVDGYYPSTLNPQPSTLNPPEEADASPESADPVGEDEDSAGRRNRKVEPHHIISKLV